MEQWGPFPERKQKPTYHGRAGREELCLGREGGVDGRLRAPCSLALCGLSALGARSLSVLREMPGQNGPSLVSNFFFFFLTQAHQWVSSRRWRRAHGDPGWDPRRAGRPATVPCLPGLRCPHERFRETFTCWHIRKMSLITSPPEDVSDRRQAHFPTWPV